MTAVLTMLVLAGLLVGCSNHEPQPKTVGPVTPTPSSSPAPTSAAPSPSASPVDPQAALKTTIIASYKHYWVVVDRAFAINDPNYAPLRDVSSGRQLTHLINETIINQNKGQSAAGHTRVSPRVISVSLDRQSAVVRDCQDAASSYYVDSHTKRRKYSPVTAGTRVAFDVDMSLQHGRWKVTASTNVKAC